jgi:hypothetical protein
MPDEKCAHAACECRVAKGGPFGKYCSEHCKHSGKISELRCYCQHPECRMASESPKSPQDTVARS